MDDTKVTKAETARECTNTPTKENVASKNIIEISSPQINLSEIPQHALQQEIQASEAPSHNVQFQENNSIDLAKYGVALPPNVTISTERHEKNSSITRPYITILPLNVSSTQEVGSTLPDNNISTEVIQNPLQSIQANTSDEIYQNTIEAHFTQHSVRNLETVSKNNERQDERPSIQSIGNTLTSTSSRVSESSTAQSLNGDNFNSNMTNESNLPKKPQKYKDYRYDKVELYAPDTGPKMYNVKGSIVTPPIITKNLPVAFRSLPVHGKPESNAGLEEFYRQKIRDYVGYGINDVEFEKLEEFCSPEYLKTGNELRFKNSFPSLGLLPAELRTELEDEGPGENLCILRKFKLRKLRDKQNHYPRRLKYRGMRLLPLAQEQENQTEMDFENDPEGPLEPGRDLIFRLRIYRPFAYGPKDPKPSRHSVFNNDMVVLGRQRLTELRDRLGCPNDVGMRVDISDCPDSFCSQSAKDMFPSGFLFINNVFYVDCRPGCCDQSAVIRDWARRRQLGDFPVRDMGAVRLDQLVIKLGHPEVYMHQGNCEHVFTFSEVRLLGPSDPPHPSQYPRHSAVSQHQSIYCTSCAEFGAKWIVTGCSRVPFDPAFFCDTCFKLYLYDKDGNKIGDFKAYSYKGNMINFLKPVFGKMEMDASEFDSNEVPSSSNGIMHVDK